VPRTFPYTWRRRGRRPRGEASADGALSAALGPPLPEPRPGLKSLWARYATGAALAALAFSLERRAPGFFSSAVFLLFYPCAYITAELGGTGPALVNIALSAAGAYWIFHGSPQAPMGLDAPSLLRLSGFCAFASFGCALIGRGRLAAAALRSSETRLRVFRAFAEASSDFIGLADPEGRPTYVNPAGKALVGLPPDLPVERTRIEEYYPPDIRVFARETILKTMLERGVWKGETAFRNFRTDQRIPVWDEHFVIRDDAGALLGFGTVTRDLTERRRVEDALRLSEDALKRAQEVARIGSWRLDMTRNELVWSDETFRIFGLAPGSPLSYDEFLERVHPEDRAIVDREWKAALRGKPYDIEHRIVINGAVKWVNERAEVEVDADGRALRGVGTVQDVTARRRAEEEVRALRETERFRLALEAAATAMIIVARDGSILFANGEAEALFGWAREELTGRPLETLLPERFRGAHGAMAEGFFREETASRPMGRGRDLFALRKDGTEVPVEIGLTRFKDHGSEDFVVASITDISQRKAAEEERNRLLKQALDSEERLRLLVQGTREYAIYMQDLEGRITVWNEGGARIFGYSAKEALGASFRRLTPPDVLASGRPDEELRLALQRGSWSSEDWRLRKDGSRFWASVVTTPLFAADCRHLGFGKVVRDLTEPRRAARELEETAERLRRTVLELESFAYTISHDLRSPLRAIEGYAHFLSNRLAGTADDETRRMLGRMAGAAARLDRLIRDLLSYNAVARQEVQLSPVDLDETLSHVVAHYPEVARASVRVRAPLGKALGQESLLIQVLSNLLANAVKFVPPDRKPEIEIRAEREGGRVTVVVQDNGIGIPREAWERVFQPFERLHPETAYEGTGIGLAIVKRAAEKMGGSVSLDSEPGRGSLFRVSLKEA
jgi:PAS domain S-box-containing protein